VSGLSPAISSNQVINNLKLMHPDGTMKNGAVLFFGSQPENFIEKAVIRCVAFDGNDKTYIIDDKVFTGPLMIQYRQAMQWLKTKLNVKYIIQGAGPRKEIWEIPESALKEAIINALTHRDYYDKGARTTIEVFKNRLEIRNPGGLVSAIKPKDFGTLSHSRNPLVFGLFERIDMVEQIGSGIARIRNEMAEAQLLPPQFITEGTFAVILQRLNPKQDETKDETKDETRRINTPETRGKTRGKTRRKNKDLIIELITQNDQITIPELADALGITEKGISYHITNLKKEGIIDRKGPSHGGKWIIRYQQTPKS
jgi:ATP-dependent DNA helicase RecG